MMNSKAKTRKKLPTIKGVFLILTPFSQYSIPEMDA